eukprot:jgi/Galph1/5924/GphlegSOOS_G4606.1
MTTTYRLAHKSMLLGLKQSYSPMRKELLPQTLTKRYAATVVSQSDVKQSPFWSLSIKQLVGDSLPEKYVCKQSSSVIDALKQMEKADISILAVAGEKNQWLGIFSERDLIRLVAKGGSVHQTKLLDATTKKEEAAACSVDQKLLVVGNIFSTRDVQNIVVLKKENSADSVEQLAGLMTSRELAQYFHSLPSSVVKEFDRILVKDMLENHKSKVRDRLGEQSVLAVEYSTRVKDVVNLMANYAMGCVLVTSDESKGALHPYPDIVGMFTEREYIRECVLKGKDNHSKVGDILQPRSMALVTPEFTATQFLRLFTDSHVRYLPVFSSSIEDAQDSTSMCLGLFSIKDVFSYCYEHAA